MPGSPDSSTTRPSPAFACCQRRSSNSNSSSRPTSGITFAARSASKRLCMVCSRSTRHATTGPSKPLSCAGSIGSYSNASPVSRRVLAAITTVFGCGRRLQARREVRRLADDVALLRFAGADQLADHDQAGGDADADLVLAADRERADGLDHRQRRAHGILGVGLVRLGIAEIDQHAVAHVFGDEAAEAGDHGGRAFVIGGDDVAQVFRIELRRQRGRADQIAEHHGELAALGGGGRARYGAAGARGRCGAAAAASPSLVPHCAQKRDPAALSWPQAAHFSACGAPHCGQKRLPSGISALQLGQVLGVAIGAHNFRRRGVSRRRRGGQTSKRPGISPGPSHFTDVR